MESSNNRSADSRLLEAAAEGQTDLVLQLLEEEGSKLHDHKDQVGIKSSFFEHLTPTTTHTPTPTHPHRHPPTHSHTLHIHPPHVHQTCNVITCIEMMKLISEKIL